MTSIRLVIFDIAGTSIQDHGEVVHAFAGALRQNGIPSANEDLMRWKGAAKRQVIRHFVEQMSPGAVDEGMVERTYQCFRGELERQYGAQLIAIEGAEATFAWCREHEVLMATTT